MLNINFKHEWLRHKTKVHDVSSRVANLKRNYAGHKATQKDEGWNGMILKGRPPRVEKERDSN